MRKGWKRMALAALLFLTSCGPIDPSMSGQTAHCPEHEWIPANVCPSQAPSPNAFAQAIARQRPYESCELSDIGLRNNPQTQQTWFNARAAAFNLGAAKASLYPYVEGAETLDPFR